MHYNGIFISDFTIENLINQFTVSLNRKDFTILSSPKGLVTTCLLDNNADYWDNLYFCVVWTRPESAISEFYKILNTRNVLLEEILKSVDSFTDILKAVSKKTSLLFVPSWTVTPHQRGLALNDYKDQGIVRTLNTMNQRLAENLEKEKNIFVLDANRWINLSGSKSYDPKLWYHGKILFNQKVFQEATKDIIAAINANQGLTKKLLILDLDDTLWGGIVGDIGFENLRLGGHDAIGEAFVDFQQTILNLKRRGILLAIVSKNDNNVALNAIKKHPAMVLKIEDFASWRINWDDKAKNIIEIVTELNLGFESVVFLDDSLVERARVSEAIPDVYVPDLPTNPMLYNNFLLDLNCFDVVSHTKEDINRNEMYENEKKRKVLRASTDNLQEWLGGLDIKIEVTPLSKKDLKRCVQLLNKTNQMNLSTRRMVESDYMKWSKEKGVEVLTFRVSDKYGDYGLTGILSINKKESNIQIIDYVLSCRVMGRGVEETMLYIAYQCALDNHAKELLVPFKKTEKNNPCLVFLKKSGLNYNKNKQLFYLKMENKYLNPDHVTIINNY